MSCPHGNPIGGCDTCDEVDAAFEAGKRSALADQPAQQEPVAWLDPWTQNNVTTDYDAYGKHGIPLYTSLPAQRKPLTDEEIEQCMKQAYATVQGRNLEHAFARAIEAAHGIKGEA